MTKGSKSENLNGGAVSGTSGAPREAKRRKLLEATGRRDGAGAATTGALSTATAIGGSNHNRVVGGPTIQGQQPAPGSRASGRSRPNVPRGVCVRSGTGVLASSNSIGMPAAGMSMSAANNLGTKNVCGGYPNNTISYGKERVALDGAEPNAIPMEICNSIQRPLAADGDLKDKEKENEGNRYVVCGDQYVRFVCKKNDGGKGTNITAARQALQAYEDILLTPQRKKVDINDFTLAIDMAEVRAQNQAKTHAAYRAEVDQRMMQCERAPARKSDWFRSFGCVRSMTPVACGPSGETGSSAATVGETTNGAMGASNPWLEACRLETIRRYFEYGKEMSLRPQTIYLAIHTLGRLFNHLLESKALTQEMVVGSVGSAWRLAVKWSECPHIAYKASITPNIYHHLVFLQLPNMREQEFNSLISCVEAHCADVLRTDISVPFSIDFFDRFLEIGGWPNELAKAYRELGHFLISICLFDTKTSPYEERNPLSGTYPSLLATAAMVLAVKIINTDATIRAYEYYPKRLEAYTGYPMSVLKPTIQGISRILREKPKQSNVLSLWFPNWAAHDWR